MSYLFYMDKDKFFDTVNKVMFGGGLTSATIMICVSLFMLLCFCLMCCTFTALLIVFLVLLIIYVD